MFNNLFGKNSEIVMSEDYKNWRTLTFGISASEAGISNKDADQVYGVLMDFGMQDQQTKKRFALTTSALASGEAAFHPTPSGGFDGLGANANIAQAARDIIQMAQGLIPQTKPVTDTSLPMPGYARFYFLTTSNTRLFEIHINDLQKPDHPFYDMLRAFSFIRQLAEKLIDQRQANKRANSAN
jgi:hypothetical protein